MRMPDSYNEKRNACHRLAGVSFQDLADYADTGDVLETVADLGPAFQSVCAGSN